MSEESSQDKSYDATPERIRKARKEGNVPSSPDLNALVTYIGFSIGVLAIGGSLTALAGSLVGFFIAPEEMGARLLYAQGPSRPILAAPLTTLGRLVAPAAAAVIVALILEQAIVFAPKKLKPDLKRILPWEGAKKKFGPQGFSEFLKSAGKLLAVAFCGVLWFWGRREYYGGLLGVPPGDVYVLLQKELLGLCLIAIAIGAFVAAVDVPIRRMAHARKLKMSRQEVTDENKEMEGDPTQKQSRRKRAQELSRNQQLRDVSTADVVIVNPTHYAVALKWDRDGQSVPVCVAKGVDNFAKALIDRARMSAVPVREDPPCARALHASVGVGETIEAEHFIAVAAAIRFADRVRKAR